MEAISGMLLIICPGIISDIWFPLTETSMASSISAGAFALGNAIGLFAPTLAVPGPVKTYNTTKYPQNWSSGSLGEAAVQEVTIQLVTLFTVQARVFIFIKYMFGPTCTKFDPYIIYIYR
mgnify:CR=1 FL=1